MVKLTDIFKVKMSPIAKGLTFSNILSTAGWAFISPIFALYVVKNIKEANIATVGLAYLIYWVIKALFQLFISDYLDRLKGEMDDYTALIIGQFMLCLVPFLLIFTRTPFELYLVFFLYGFADAFWVPAWNSLFTRHVNPEQVSFQWALNSSGFNLASALAILIGSSFAMVFGFFVVFVAVIIAQIISFFILLSLRKYFYKKLKAHKDYFLPLKS